MSFLEFMISNTEYNGWTSLFGAGRFILWMLTWILTFICNIIEQAYNHIFSLFGVIYNEKVIGFLQGWIGYLWIPVAISILILGYNLIMGDATEGNARAKTFVRNLCLFAIILFGLPYLFLGNTTQAGVFTGGSSSGYRSSGTITSNSGLLDVFTNDNGQGIVNGVKQLGGNIGNSSHTYDVVADNTYDLPFIFTQVENGNGGAAKSKTWSQEYIEKEKIKKNIFQIPDSEGGYTSKKGDSIMSISINDFTDYVDVDKIGQDKFKVSDVMVDGYDYGLYSTDDNNKTDIHKYFLSNTPDASSLTSDSEYKPSEVSLRQYLFKTYHSEVIRDYNDEGKIRGVWYSNNGKTQSGAIAGIGSNFPFKYKVDWGVMFIQLISAAIVMILTTYKVARIIYEIIFNHFLALFFGAADLSNGQRIKEILKSIVSLLLSLLFAVVLVEFYFILSEAVKTIEFIPNDVAANKWMQALVEFFIAVATVKGPSVLEKILGVEGGLSGAWRDMGAATRPARRAAMVGAYAGAKLAKGALSKTKDAVKGAGKAGYHGINRVKGAAAARKANANGNQRSIGGGADKSRTQVAGKSSQFSAINNGKKETNAPKNANATASKNNAATAEMARQSRDLNKEMTHSATNKAVVGGMSAGEAKREASNEIANRYRGNIHNAALAEQANAGGSSKMSDKEALTRAYENSGFSKEDAASLAARDVASGSFTETKDRFDNSISAQAQQRLSENPSEYSSQKEAYQAAAMDHYQSLGFDNTAAASMADTKANQVLLDDKQAEIRNRAMEIQKTTPSYSSIEAGGSMSAPIDDSNRMSDVEALTTAAADVLHGSVGYTGNYSEAASHIYSQGTLKEGPVTGRIANNMARESAEVNTRAGSLDHGINPTAQAALTIVGGYFAEREASTLHSTGYSAGYSKYEKKNAKKTEKEYQKLKKQRDKR